MVLLYGVRAAMAGDEENCCEGGRPVRCECHTERRVLRAGDERSIVRRSVKEQGAKGHAFERKFVDDGEVSHVSIGKVRLIMRRRI